MPGLHIDIVGGGDFNNPENYIHLNFQELNSLVQNNALELGRKYQLTDYLHKYFIFGSNSDGIVDHLSIYSYVYGYATFGYYVYDLPVGKEVTITSLPEGYVGNIKVGDITKVSVNSQNWYFQFSNGMHSITGLGFKIYLSRFNTIEEGSVINDLNGRPVMIPKGLINTQVHDGNPYMAMSAAENIAVLPEQLILTADSQNSFQKLAESATYPGDLVEFDFFDTDINNDNYERIGERNGFIKRRTNERLGMDLPVDWRVQKYRRWCLDLDSRTKFLNQHLDVNNTRLGFEGKWLFTAGNRKVDQPQYFFIAMTPEGELMNLDSNAQKTTFQYSVTAPNEAKDFTIVPLDEERNPVDAYVKAKYFSNSVFLVLPGEDTSGVNVDTNSLYSSTFISSTLVGDSKGYFDNVISLDFLSVLSYELRLSQVNVLSKSQIRDSEWCDIENCIIGTMQNGIRINENDSPIPVVWWVYARFTNSTLINVAFSGVTPFFYVIDSRLVETSFFAYYSPTHPNVANDSKYQREVFKIQSGVYSKVGMRFLNNVDRVILENLFFLDSNTNRANGHFLYDFRDGVYSRILKKNEATQAIYFEEMDENYNRTFYELSKQRENLIDTGINMVVDNAAPIVGTNVVFTLTAINSGTIAATNVLVISLLPSGYTFVSDNATGAYNSVSGNWLIGNLAAGESKIISITATVNDAGNYTLNAEISAKELETAPADNTVSISTVPTAATV